MSYSIQCDIQEIDKVYSDLQNIQQEILKAFTWAGGYFRGRLFLRPAFYPRKRPEFCLYFRRQE